MVVIQRSARVVKDFAVKQMEATGSILLRSASAKIDGKYVNASYEWQYTTDDGVTWIALPTTINKAKTIAKDMVVGVATIFRKRITTSKGGTSAWVVSKPITPE